MKKIFILIFIFLSLSKSVQEPGDLPDFTPMFAIRSLETGISLSPFRETSQKLEDQNWILREIVLDDKLKQKDELAEELPLAMCNLLIQTIMIYV